MAAAQHYDIAAYTLNRWNKEYRIYTPRATTDYIEYTPAQQQEILRYALAVYNALPADARSARQVFTEIAPEFLVTIDQLYVWNRKFRIVPTRSCDRMQISDAEIADIQNTLNASRGSVAATARKTGRSELTINKLIESGRIGFNKGRNIKNKDMPIGQKKSRIIGNILSGLLSRHTH